MQYPSSGQKTVTSPTQYAVFHALSGTRWADLPTVDAETAARATKLRTQLVGDPAFQYTIEEADPAAAGKGSDAAAAGDEDAPAGLNFVVTELQRLRSVIDNVNTLTAVQPKVGW